MKTSAAARMQQVMMLLTLVVVLSISNVAMAVNYTVGGDNGGWDQTTDLTAWSSSQTFREGDNLIFRYTSNHNIIELSAADFASCTTTNPLGDPFTGGFTVIPLTAAGSRYFTCGTAGHCLSGMKLQVETLAAAAPPPATPSVPSPPSASPSVPSPPSATPSVPSPPPTPSPHRPASSPPPKSSKTPSRTEYKAAASNPALPPSSAPPPAGSPAPSSATKFKVMGGVAAACAGFLIVAA